MVREDAAEGPTIPQQQGCEPGTYQEFTQTAGTKPSCCDQDQKYSCLFESTEIYQLRIVQVLTWSEASRSFFYLVFGLNQIQIAGGDVYSVAFVFMNIHFTESFINNNERVLDIDVGEAGVTFEDCPAVGLEPLRVEIYKRQPKPNSTRCPTGTG
jgi:hypothetical protein